MDRIRTNPNVVLQTMDTGALLMNAETGDCFELNGVGRDVWQELQENRAVPEIAQAIAERYGADPTEVSSDVADLVATLVHHGILIRE